MRAIIATDFESQLRKVVWITENATGVSAGICERKPNPHATYHIDGTHHYKIRSKGRVLKMFEEKKCPLAQIKGRQPLLVTGAFYAANTMRHLPRLTSDPRLDTLLVLGQAVFRILVVRHSASRYFTRVVSQRLSTMLTRHTKMNRLRSSLFTCCRWCDIQHKRLALSFTREGN